MKIIQHLAYKKLESILQDNKRQVQVPKLDSIKKIGILWLKDQQQAFQYLHDYYSPAGIIIRNICIDLNHNTVENNSNVITSKNLNWLGIPKSGTIEVFTDSEFDILFSIVTIPCYVADYIVALSKAKFKVGSAKGIFNYFDLNINIEDNHDAIYLVKQQIFYLGELNK